MIKVSLLYCVKYLHNFLRLHFKSYGEGEEENSNNMCTYIYLFVNISSYELDHISMEEYAR